MARPKMKFTPDEARSLTYEFWTKTRDLKFCERNLSQLTRHNKFERAEEARRTIDALQTTVSASRRDGQELLLPLDFPEQVRGWIETQISEAGWKRLLATRRQRDAACKRRAGSVVDNMGPYYWGLLAEKLGVDKKELLNRIPAWLYHDDDGKAAFETFAHDVKGEQHTAGLKLLVEVFELGQEAVRRALYGSGTHKSNPEQARSRDCYRDAFFAGKPKLLQLSKAFKQMPAEARLHKIARVVELNGKTLLESAATGNVKELLAGFVSSCDDDATV